jgi:glycerol-3-phosphate dehydrogenase
MRLALPPATSLPRFGAGPRHKAPVPMIGLARTGDLVATAGPQSRNRRAGGLLAEGVSADDIPGRIGQPVETLESVPVLARALAGTGLEAPRSASRWRP